MGDFLKFPGTSQKSLFWEYWNIHIPIGIPTTVIPKNSSITIPKASFQSYWESSKDTWIGYE